MLRRRFIQTAVALSISTAFCASAFAAKALEADVVVIGTGSAGMTAAVSAAENGAKVIALEKNAFIGGGSAFAEGLFAVESKHNRNRCDTLTRAQAYDIMMKRTMYEIDPMLTRDFIYGSAENIEWLEKHNVPFQVLKETGWKDNTWHTVATYKGVNHGAALIRALKDNADRLGVKILLSTPAKSLITKDGAVVGVKARDEEKDKDITINAKRVIIATGGIMDDPEKVEKWGHRDPKGIMSSVPLNKTGDGLKMAYDVGADKTTIIFNIHLGTPASHVTFAGDLYATSWQPATLWVNTRGDRFANEYIAAGFTEGGNAIYAQFGHTGWSIFDETQVEYMVKEGIDSGIGVIVPVGTKLGKLRAEIKNALKKKSDGFFAAGSVEELAKKIGVNEKNLKQAVADYNKACDMGFDPMFQKDVKYLRKLDTKKLYAIKLAAYAFNTIGGLRIDRQFHVLDVKNNPIPGLYAAGVDCGNIDGHNYSGWFSGHAFGFSAFSGRWAGFNAAKDVKAAKK